MSLASQINALATAIATEIKALKPKTARVSTVGAITLSGTQTIDGVAVVAGDRVLVRNQGVFAGNSYDNGIWVVAAGAWSRATDYNTSAKIALSSVYVQEGTNFAGMTFRTNFKATDTLGTTALGFWSTRVETGTIFEQPLNGGHGQIFYNDANRYLSIWDGATWSSPKGIQDYGSTAPVYPKTGELWFDPSDTSQTPGPWATFTPAWTASTTNPAIGNGTIVGAYEQVGKTVNFRVVITMGTTTTYGTGQWRVSLPVSTKTVSGGGPVRFTATAEYLSAGGELIGHGVCDFTNTYMSLFTPGTTAGGYSRAVVSNIPFAWASTNVLTIHGTYEAN